ncbi:MAG: hypothetical protein QOD93_5473 [Acetobacteraceae bacterium]|nr:hypothetical protein [Acetobacteraceae bacterium]
MVAESQFQAAPKPFLCALQHNYHTTIVGSGYKFVSVADADCLVAHVAEIPRPMWREDYSEGLVLD